MDTSNSHISLNRHLTAMFDIASPTKRIKIEKIPDTKIINMHQHSNSKNPDNIKDELNDKDSNKHQNNLNDNNSLKASKLSVDTKKFHFENEKNNDYIIENLIKKKKDVFNINRLVKTNNEIDSNRKNLKPVIISNINQYQLELNVDNIENMNFIEIYSPCNSWDRNKIDFTTCLIF